MKTVVVGNVTVSEDSEGVIYVSTPSEHDADRHAMLAIEKEPIGDRMWCVRKLAEAVLNDGLVVTEKDICAAQKDMLGQHEIILSPSFTGQIRTHLKGSRFHTAYYSNGHLHKEITDPQSSEWLPLPKSDGFPTFESPDTFNLARDGEITATLISIGHDFTGQLLDTRGVEIKSYRFMNGRLQGSFNYPAMPVIEDNAEAHGVVQGTSEPDKEYVSGGDVPSRRRTDAPGSLSMLRNLGRTAAEKARDAIATLPYERGVDVASAVRAVDFIPKRNYKSMTEGLVTFRYLDFTYDPAEPVLVFATINGEYRITEADLHKHFRREDMPHA